eukprot:COSAG02_NODE_1097_length_14589_cov_6.159075_3_plen_51_part_00
MVTRVRKDVAEVSCLNHEDSRAEIRYGKALGPSASLVEARFCRNPVGLEI